MAEVEQLDAAMADTPTLPDRATAGAASTAPDAASTEATPVAPTDADPAQADPARADATRADATQADAAQIDAVQVDAVQVDAAQADTAQADTVLGEAVQAEPALVEAAQADTAVAGDVPPGGAWADPAPWDATPPEAAQFDSTRFDSAQFDSASFETARFDRVSAPGYPDNGWSGPATSFADEDTMELAVIGPPAPLNIPEHHPMRRLLPVGGAAVALIAAVGLGWAVIGGPATPQAAPVKPAPPVSAAPATPDFSTGARPGATGVSAPSPSASPTPSAVAATSAPASAQPTTGNSNGNGNGNGNGGAGSRPPAGQPRNPAQSPAAPVPPPVPVADREPGRLSATLSRAEDGVSGSIRVLNAGEAAAGNWRVTLTLPDAVPVRGVWGAGVQQNGATLVFTPVDGATVPAGGSVTFTFRLRGEAGAPIRCDVNGVVCDTEVWSPEPSDGDDSW